MGKGAENGDIYREDGNTLITEKEKKGKAGFFLSVFNLMNAILGSGILGLSYAMAQLGVVMFCIICSGVALLAFYAIVLMLNMCKKTGAKVCTVDTYKSLRFFGDFYRPINRYDIFGSIFFVSRCDFFRSKNNIFFGPKLRLSVKIPIFFLLILHFGAILAVFGVFSAILGM